MVYLWDFTFRVIDYPLKISTPNCCLTHCLFSYSLELLTCHYCVRLPVSLSLDIIVTVFYSCQNHLTPFYSSWDCIHDNGGFFLFFLCYSFFYFISFFVTDFFLRVISLWVLGYSAFWVTLDSFILLLVLTGVVLITIWYLNDFGFNFSFRTQMDVSLLWKVNLFSYSPHSLLKSSIYYIPSSVTLYQNSCFYLDIDYLL